MTEEKPDKNQISFRLDDPTLKRRFDSKRGLEGRQQKEVMIALIRRYVEEGDSTPKEGTTRPQETPASSGDRIPLEFSKKLDLAASQARGLAQELAALADEAHGSRGDDSDRKAKGSIAEIKKARK